MRPGLGKRKLKQTERQKSKKQKLRWEERTKSGKFLSLPVCGTAQGGGQQLHDGPSLSPALRRVLTQSLDTSTLPAMV